jgi:hypothetical protein
MPSLHSRQTLLQPGEVFSAPQCGQVTLQTASDIAICKRTCATSAVGTVQTTAPHSLQTRPISSPHSTVIRHPQHSGSPTSECGTMGSWSRSLFLQPLSQTPVRCLQFADRVNAFGCFSRNPFTGAARARGVTPWLKFSPRCLFSHVTFLRN